MLALASLRQWTFSQLKLTDYFLNCRAHKVFCIENYKPCIYLADKTTWSISQTVHVQICKA